jgi:hypothetical protein
MKRLPLVALIFFSIACINPPDVSDAVPSDLEIAYSYGACHAEWGRTNIVIDAQGRGVYESGSGSLTDDGRFENEKFRKTFTLSEKELLDLLNGIEKSGFYSLRESYFSPDIMDGGCESIMVSQDNSTKFVSLSNVNSPESYSKVAGMISAIAENKTSYSIGI